MAIDDNRSAYAGVVSLREVAHLTHYCSLVGSGSGASVAASSTAAKPLPMIQLFSRLNFSVLASFAHDYKASFNIKDRQILELTDKDPRQITTCIATTCKQGISAAIDVSDNSRIPARFDHYFGLITQMLPDKHRYIDAARSLMCTAERYGWRPGTLAHSRRKSCHGPPACRSRAGCFQTTSVYRRNCKIHSTTVAETPSKPAR